MKALTNVLLILLLIGIGLEIIGAAREYASCPSWFTLANGCRVISVEIHMFRGVGF